MRFGWDEIKRRARQFSEAAIVDDLPRWAEAFA